MIRKIIKIDEEKCNGCGACANACHEEAIAIIDGKARLIRDDYCDGLGNCLPACPMDAISFIEREAAEYNEAAVEENKKKKAEKAEAEATAACRGGFSDCNAEAASSGKKVSRLAQWPCQIKLVPVSAPYFDGANLLIAADCTAYAYAGMHEEFMNGRFTLIGCPKLDGVDYSEKLGAIFEENNINDITLLRMEVPCCGGLEHAADIAVKRSGKDIQFKVVTFTLDGKIKSVNEIQ